MSTLIKSNHPIFPCDTLDEYQLWIYYMKANYFVTEEEIIRAMGKTYSWKNHLRYGNCEWLPEHTALCLGLQLAVMIGKEAFFFGHNLKPRFDKHGNKVKRIAKKRKGVDELKFSVKSSNSHCTKT